MALFISFIYIRYWHQANIAQWAPNNDIEFYKQVKSYPDNELALAAEKSIRRHLWYVSPVLVVLAFFDERLSNDIKLRMVEHLKNPFTGKECKR